MSNKRNARRAAYQERQAKAGRNVVVWMIGVLIVLALAYFVYIVSIS